MSFKQAKKLYDHEVGVLRSRMNEYKRDKGFGTGGKSLSLREMAADLNVSYFTLLRFTKESNVLRSDTLLALEALMDRLEAVE